MLVPQTTFLSHQFGFTDEIFVRILENIGDIEASVSAIRCDFVLGWSPGRILQETSASRELIGSGRLIALVD